MTEKRLKKLTSTAQEDNSETKKYIVIYEENGMDLFPGSYSECQDYINNIQVLKFGNKSTEFGIYPE